MGKIVVTEFVFSMRLEASMVRSYKDSLLAGHRPSPQTASQAGTLLATMINGSRAPELREHLEEEFRDRTVFDQLRIDVGGHAKIPFCVMAGLVPAIHVLFPSPAP